MTLPHVPSPGPVLFSSAQIHDQVARLGREIDAECGDSVPVLVTVLKGATIFASDLARALTIQHEMDFIAVSAFGEDGSATHARVLKDLQNPIAGREVILIEDIVDTGLTLRYIMRWIATHEPASIRVCTLLDRSQRRLADIPVSWRAFAAPDRFVVGYGFDYQQNFRNLPDIHVLEHDDDLAKVIEHGAWSRSEKPNKRVPPGH